MASLLQSTLNTRALPVGSLRYIRSDYPGNLTDQEVKWLLQNDITTIVDLREEKEYIATTSELLSTGVDTKMVKVIVLDKSITSMTSFKQIIGRGTRIVEKAEKLSFVVMDFRGVSRLFADPDWDGSVEIDPEFVPGGGEDPSDGTDNPAESGDDSGDPNGTDDDEGGNYKPIVDKDGCTVKVYLKRVSIYDPHGKLLRQESIIDYTKTNIRGEYGTLDRFITYWSKLKKKTEMGKGVTLSAEEVEELKKALERI